MTATRIRRLTLTNFRNYHAAQSDVGEGPVVLVGPNGAGKTNLIEAISWLAPGRGLRRATLDEVAFTEGNGAWAVAAEIEGALGLATLGTGIDAPSTETAPASRNASSRASIRKQMRMLSNSGLRRRSVAWASSSPERSSGFLPRRSSGRLAPRFGEKR